MKHLNPRQGITIELGFLSSVAPLERVKHLNPRQGITIKLISADEHIKHLCVKHLNPRQGITIVIHTRMLYETDFCRITCETPKSPPGDYNPSGAGDVLCPREKLSVKHLNPRQGITMSGTPHYTRHRTTLCV